MGIKKEDVTKALDELESHLPKEDIQKASEQDLDQPEGDDMGYPRGKKMSDEAGGKKKMDKKEYKSETPDTEEETSTTKSYSEDLPDEIQTKIDVSNFLKSLVNHTGETIDSLRDAIEKSEEKRDEQHEDVAKAIVELHESQGKLAVVLKAICERIGIIENAPAKEPKAETVSKSEGTKPVEREFKSSVEDEGEHEPLFKGLAKNPYIAKSQISNALCDLVKKGEAEDVDVITFESTNFLKPELVTKLQKSFN